MSYRDYLAGERADRDYNSSPEPPSVPPKESSLTFDLQEALGLPPPTASTVELSAKAVPRETPPPIVWPQPPSLPQPAGPQSAGPQSAAGPQTAGSQTASPQTTSNMATTSKAQSQCLQLCNNTAAAGDRVAERMAEYATLVKHMPHGFDTLANDLLDTCQVLFYIEAGLGEAVQNGQALPLDMITVLDKKFRAAQTDFRVLDQVVSKNLEYERSGAMGRMRRGFGKVFGDNSTERMTVALAKTREDLKMSAFMFQWNLGSDKLESELGIGYIGLAAALDGTDLRRKRAGSMSSEGRSATHRGPHMSLAQRSVEDHRLASALPPQLPTLHPPPRGDKASPFSHDSLSAESSAFGGSALEHAQDSPTTGYTASSSTSSYDGIQPRKAGANDRLGVFNESYETSRETSHEMSRELEALLADIANLDLDSSKVMHLKSEPFTVPRRRPRSKIDADKTNGKHALVSAIRNKDHKLLVQLLDRGVSPNTGADLHALNEAVLSQDAESVRILLVFGADPNDADGHGVSPLVAAAEKSFVPAAGALLKYGADPNLSTGPELESPLCVAAMANNVRFAHLLLMYGGNPNQSTASGDTLLIGSINKKTPNKLIDMLLGYGADPNEKSREGKTALFEAISVGRADIVTSLIEHGANPNLPGPKHMLWPSTYQPQCLQILLDNGADYKKCPGIMELATSINSIESIRILLKAGVDPNAKKDGVYTPLCTAIRDDRNEILQLLLSSGADPNVPASEYPAFKCLTHHREHFLPTLIAAGVNLNSPRGILETAVTSNSAKGLKWLLDQGIDPDDKTPKGHTALTSAIRDNKVEFVDTLLAHGANPNVRGQDWPVCMAVRHPELLKRILTVLPEPRAFKGVMEMAVVANQLESVKLLLGAGVSVEDRNGGVFSPLTTAIREYHKDIVSYLITEGGADVNAPGEHLPIVKALRRLEADSTDIIDMLLEKGADPNKMYRGWNGIMQALENGDPEMLKKLAQKSGVDLEVKDELDRTVTEIAVSRRWEEAVSILLASAS
ncbi:putative ankyrin repeat protein [Tolypocladium ophioglossoides CBS 100239]|uniref:Putative ankyrin repeat protein n=1 Tax=Tolypocladium ophioglossoides (strain CBS 100239) TaxID=1163406 RepID=A0A0L0MYA3_TOLOC|nr:putative ankyrin repeat protein [Tolypocladium ophioglossoides CBS 100239]